MSSEKSSKNTGGNNNGKRISDSQRSLMEILRFASPSSYMDVVNQFLHPTDIKHYEELTKNILQIICMYVAKMKLRKPDSYQINTILCKLIEPENVSTALLESGSSARDVLQMVIDELERAQHSRSLNFNDANIGEDVPKRFAQFDRERKIINMLISSARLVIYTRDTNMDNVRIACIYMLLMIRDTIDREKIKGVKEDLFRSSYVQEYSMDSRKGQQVRYYGKIIMANYYQQYYMQRPKQNSYGSNML